jgi:maltooligosyltrehalose trehalohydrolase
MPAAKDFVLWAPDAETVDLLLGDRRVLPMERDFEGYFKISAEAEPGTKYRFRINGDTLVPDPAAKLQMRDVHGESVVVESDYPWRNQKWRGRPWAETVLYEIHPGLAGGFTGIAAQLPRLAALGITAIELMPIGDFPGTRNWGYDGVLIFAPATAYGTPDELRAMIDAAHALGIQVFLDVVYNHFGPDGNYLNTYAKSFFREDVHTPWGHAIDFRKPPVQKFFIENALYWLQDYRFDGLRFDAVHAINDRDFLIELGEKIRASVAPGRYVHLVLENEHNDASLLGGEKFTAQWSDDWHHCLHVMLTGEQEGYYEDFATPAAQLARCLSEGFAYQGEPSAHAGQTPRGTPSAHLPCTAFVICLQNHDQIGNRAFGERLHALAAPEALRAAIALLLFTPQIPMIFMGEEWGEQRPFLYFTDHAAELGRLVREGRRKEFTKFAAFQNASTREKIPDPNALETFIASKPAPAETEWSAFYKTCLDIRHQEIIPRLACCSSLGAEILGAKAVRARWLMADSATLTLAINLGSEPVACPPGQNLRFGAFDNGQLPPNATCLWLDA